ncbi:DNA ligase-associated DEXH box helicase [Bordetella genomosp. 9]|uniref:DNA ligase-associated DEXH box helicase n=1 Tax=Bordetella genomosp. 9 TaxID=1416803 RepID=A0A261R3F8_9BORD|nr:ligase-associated DNA damage response exonuclease [Bordetella genomosp. 9]OZI19140.1 DNA ligase-associated DEXH box helicase [Bordetella genomosp. 9]
MDLIVARPEGLYCPPGNFYIDPWRPVERAIITHAHSDHARAGHAHYLASSAGAGVLRARVGDVDLDAVPYGETRIHNGVRISLFPAGHVLGSAQVRLEHGGQVWVASGDYKLQEDGTCDPFEPVPCDVFITESTFGLPVYRWDDVAQVRADINAWWAANAAVGRASILYCYAFGKAQRILHGLDAAIGPIVTHGAVEGLNRVYRASGVALPPTITVSEITDPAQLRRALVLAPPSARGTPWTRRFGEHADAFASGWMRLRGARRRRGVDRGFVMSDHADWPGLGKAIRATGAERVIVTHGSVAVLVRWLNELGLRGESFTTEYGAEEDEGGPDKEQGATRAGASDEAASDGAEAMASAQAASEARARLPSDPDAGDDPEDPAS